MAEAGNAAYSLHHAFLFRLVVLLDSAQRRLERALDTLPDGMRQVLILHDVEGYRHEEIAELAGIAAGTS